MNVLVSILLVLETGTALAVGPALTVMPRELRGLPGEPLCAALTVITSDARPVDIRIPDVSNLVVRAVEKIPIQRTADGLFVQGYRIIWQGLNSGSVTVTNLTAVFQETRQTFPSLKITVDDVEAALPPAKGAGQ